MIQDLTKRFFSEGILVSDYARDEALRRQAYLTIFFDLIVALMKAPTVIKSHLGLKWASPMVTQMLEIVLSLARRLVTQLRTPLDPSKLTRLEEVGRCTMCCVLRLLVVPAV